MKALTCFLISLALLLQIGAAPLPFNQSADRPLPPRQRTYPPGPEARYPLAIPSQVPEPEMATQKLPFSPEGVETLYDWSRGVVASLRDYDAEIYSLATLNDNQPFVRLTNQVGDDYQPRLSPDTQKITFTSERSGDLEVWVMGWDGSNPIRLTSSKGYDGEAVWSPDGKRLAFVSKRTGGYEIWGMGSDGTNPIQLSSTGGSAFAPTWSPDGSQIAFIQVVSATDGVIIVMNADGSGSYIASGLLRYVSDLDWSPKEDRLAFDYDPNGDGWLELGVLNLATDVITQITYNYTNADDYLGCWDPSGTNLFFSDVRYVLSGGTYYISSAKLTLISALSGPEHPYTESVFDISADTQSRDHTIPVSYVQPLPPYSRGPELRVSWSGYDPGPALVNYYDIETRQDGSSTWQLWVDNQKSPQFYPFIGTPGVKYYFRSRAFDEAGNAEPWPEGDGDAYTTWYRNQLDVLVHDNRGLGIPDASLSIDPPVANPPVSSDAGGGYLGYNFQYGLHSIQASRSGYGALGPVGAYLNRDMHSPLLLPPADNMLPDLSAAVQNTGISSWQISGNLSITVTTGHSADFGVQAGHLCPPPCLELESPPITDLPIQHAGVALASDSLGNLHMLFSHHWYSMRTPDGVWSTPQELPGIDLPSSMYELQPELEVDSSDTLHAVIQGSTDLFYLSKPSEGNWSAPASLGGLRRPSLAIDSQNALHLTYETPYPGYSISYRKRSPSGIWSEPIILATTRGESEAAVGPDGSVHILYGPGDGLDLSYTRINPDGRIFGKHITAGYGGAPQIAIDANGVAHFLSYYFSTGRYWSLDPQGNLSPPEDFNIGSTPIDLVIGADGSVVIAGGTYQVDVMNIFHKYIGDTGFTQTAVGVTPLYPEYVEMEVDRSGVLHLAFSDAEYLTYYTQQLAGSSGDAIMQTSLEIPSGMHEPTLALAYSLDSGGQQANSTFDVSLQSPFSQTVLLETGALTDWTYRWFDLGAWQGERVTLTLRLQQAVNEPYMRLRLDEVSLGSWLTPRITSLTPAKAPARTALPVTLTGENFISTPSVSIGGLPANQVNLVDEHTLTALLPADLAPGIYPLTVTNPGGQQAVFLALVVGEHIFLPVLGRQLLP